MHPASHEVTVCGISHKTTHSTLVLTSTPPLAPDAHTRHSDRMIQHSTSECLGRGQRPSPWRQCTSCFARASPGLVPVAEAPALRSCRDSHDPRTRSTGADDARKPHQQLDCDHRPSRGLDPQRWLASKLMSNPFM